MDPGPESPPGRSLPAAGAAISAVPDGDGDDGPTSAVYTVHLEAFEGPLDLLLYLIQRDELDIYDIPIARITREYLETLEQIEVAGLDNAGEFLVMAATLMRIKARMLLPIQRPEEDDEAFDPRDELVRRLLEYKKYKEAAEQLGAAEEQRRDFFRHGTEYPFLDEAKEEPPELRLSMADLLSAVQNVFDRLQGENVHHVYREVYTVAEQTRRILELLEEAQSLSFEAIFEEARVKMEVVVTFVALLELMKQGRVRARQASCYGDIHLYATAATAETSPGDGPKTALGRAGGRGGSAREATDAS